MVVWCLQTATCGATVIKVAHPDNSAPTHLHAVESRLSDSTDEVVHLTAQGQAHHSVRPRPNVMGVLAAVSLAIR
jgi:hypothetical protein